MKWAMEKLGLEPVLEDEDKSQEGGRTFSPEMTASVKVWRRQTVGQIWEQGEGGSGDGRSVLGLALDLTLWAAESL